MKVILVIILVFLCTTLFPRQVYANDQFCDPSGVVTDEILDGAGNPNRLYTAFGCMDVSNASSSVSFFLTWGLGIVGGVAFLMLIIASIQIIVARGDPSRLKSAKDLLNSVIGGILLLIFGVFILELIGVDILRLPGL